MIILPRNKGSPGTIIIIYLTNIYCLSALARALRRHCGKHHVHKGLVLSSGDLSSSLSIALVTLIKSSALLRNTSCPVTGDGVFC